jgi:crossover junction endodeoxyribonuclease RuvC
MGKILGIDPGYGIVGFGIIHADNHTPHILSYGCITTPKEDEFSQRLCQIYADMQELIAHYQPDIIACEKLYFSKNVTTGLDVAHARGVILLAAAQANLPLYEFTPNAVKQAMTGNGAAKKRDVQEMVRRIYGLNTIPQPDDAADALAIAHCAINHLRFR